jgi:hypothetical protein
MTDQAFKRTRMDTKIFGVIFPVGNLLSLTPKSVKSNRKLTKCQKIIGLLMFIFLELWFYFYLFGILTKSEVSTVQKILLALLTTTYVMHNFYILIIVQFRKRNQWFRLIKYLERIPCHKSKFRLYCFQYVMSQLIVFAVLIFRSINNQNSIIVVFSIGIEIYLQIFYVVLSCIVLEMLLSRYHHQNQVLLNMRAQRVQLQHIVKVVKETKQSLFVLKSSVEIFDDIFGWTTLLNIFNVSIRTLIYVDSFIKKQGPLLISNDAGTIIGTTFQAIVLLLMWVRICRLFLIHNSLKMCF